MTIFDDFDKKIHSHWTQVTTGGANLSLSQSVLRMGYPLAKEGVYTDAQIDDYTMLSKADYLWKPPVRMTVKARFSHPAAVGKSTEKETSFLRGTAGFGFWNKPFSMQGNIFTLPESIWFFYSAPPSNMQLVPGVPGWGWKAQSIHTMRIGAFPHLFPLSISALYARITGKDAIAGKWLQRFAGAHEKVITEDMREWHTYCLEWQQNASIFWVDGKEILRVPMAPTRPLGFVAWLDNEYAIATPRGEFRFGKGKAGAQWLDIDSLKIEAL